MIGPLGDYHALKLELKYNEISEGSFSYPKNTDRGATPFYDQLVPDKLIQIDPYGIFVVREAEEVVAGTGLTKEVSLYSLEYELAGKKVILGQGTYPLWNIADQENCLLHMVLENTRHWHVGYVDANIAQRYRTFSDTDRGVLEFLQGEVQKSYGAVVVFNTYDRTVNLYDASEPAQTMPVYLSYDNLLKEGTLKELSENLITKLYVQGADGVDIRNVNPTGDNYIYNLDWYIQNGDLGADLAGKWQSWQNSIASQQDYYAGLVLTRASKTSQLTLEKAKLTDIENAIETQEILQSAWLQSQKTPPAALAILQEDVPTQFTTYATQLAQKGAQMQEDYGDGNVDLTTRPELPIDNGYETVASMFYEADIDGSWCAIHVTPILANGSKKSQEAIRAYVDMLIAGASSTEDILARDVDNIVLAVHIKASSESSDAFVEAEGAWGEALHEAQAEYYTIVQNMRSDLSVAPFLSRAIEEDVILDTSAKSIVSLIEAMNDIDEWNQDRLDEIAQELSVLRRQAGQQRALIASLEDDLEQYASQIGTVVQNLKMSQVFNNDELKVLDHYLKEDTLQDDTFAKFDASLLDPGVVTSPIKITLQWEQVSSSSPSDQHDHIFAIAPRQNASSPRVVLYDAYGGWQCEAALVSGIADTANKVMTLVLGAGSMTAPSATTSTSVTTFVGGTITVSGGTFDAPNNGLPLTIIGASVYFTSNATGYQQLTVEQSLYDHAVEYLAEVAFPTYEFEVSSGNILFQDAFQPFADVIELGRRCYLQIDEDRCLTPVLLEIHLDFESANSFNLVFANTFRRPDNVNSLKDILRETTSAARTLKSKELSYGENNTTTTWVKELLDRGFDVAMTRINSGESSVSFGKSGIKVESQEGDIIYLGNGMIALHDSTSDTVRMAMGHFKDASGDDYVGVLADVIAGTLIAGQRLVIECPEIDANGVATGIMQFKVDSSGVQLHNGSFYMQNGGRAVCIDPTYGFMLGKTGMLVYGDNGSITPTWGMNDDNEAIDISAETFFEQQYAALWLDPNGNAYFKGEVHATDGYFEGVVQAKQFLDPNGNDIFDRNTKSEFDYLDLGGIVLDGESGNIELDGNITMKGSINLSGAIQWAGGYSSPMIYQYAATNSADDEDWHTPFNPATDKYRRESFDGGQTWGDGYQFVGEQGKEGPQGPQGPRGSAATVTWSKIKEALQTAATTETSFITADALGSPIIYGGKIYGAEFYGNAFKIMPVPEDDNLPPGLGPGTCAELSWWGADDSNSVGNRFSIYHAEGAGNGIVYFEAVGTEGASVRWNVNDTTFFNTISFGNKYDEATVDFTNANVTGLYFRFA